jgi:putative PIN family toxin of toxin-antitoxin system
MSHRICGVRIVLDTSVLVAGLRSQLGASNRVLLAVAARRCVPLVTTAVFLEYESVLLRPEQQLATGMNPADVEGFLGALASAAEPVELNFLWRPQLKDPADELMLEAAVNGRAAAIVTHNVADFRSATERFGVAAMTPAEFLKELAK